MPMTRCRLISLLLSTLSVHTAHGCTALGVTPGASVDGSVFVSHSSDAEGEGDPRAFKVEAESHAAGAMRPVYDYTARTQSYAVSGDHNLTPIGHIPQVPHTYGYLKEGYGMMNEKQVSIGESTTSSRSPVDEVKPVSRGGRALLSAYTLIELGLERCSSARCACETMGTLAESYGYYQDAGTPSGEAFIVGDTSEVWVFHILPPLTAADEYGAIWAAARVPDGHVTVVPNTFVIRDIGLDDTDNFVYSRSLTGAASSLGAWREGEPLDFTRVFGAGEYGACARQQQRTFAAPRLPLPPPLPSLPCCCPP